VRFLQIARGYALLNPHAAFRVEWDGERQSDPRARPALDEVGPNDPTSAWWYDPARFERLVAAYAGQHGERTVREFVTEFRGLTSTAKVSAVLRASGLARTTLGDLFDAKGKPSASIRRLLAEMQARSNPVKPADLGVIGREHFLSRFVRAGGDADSFEYRCVRCLDEGVPTLIEVAFAYPPSVGQRRLYMGVNWSPAIINPFRQLGSGGESLERVLAGQCTSPRRLSSISIAARAALRCAAATSRSTTDPTRATLTISPRSSVPPTARSPVTSSRP
jgi:hypothetical protein